MKYINKKQLSILLSALICVVVALHFTPIMRKSGFLDFGAQNICVDYAEPMPMRYRIVPLLKQESDFSWGTYREHEQKFYENDAGCSMPVTMRVYLW